MSYTTRQLILTAKRHEQAQCCETLVTVMNQPSLWATIAQTLRQEIGAGLYRPSEKLPTEAAFAARFGVNRHTVRQALAALAEEGLVYARRGAGVFVMGQPVDYPLGRRVRFHQNITASGRTASRKLTRLETRAAARREAEALQLDAAAQVQVVEGISLVDGVPVATFRSVFDAARFPELLVHLAQTPSITAALAASGLADYTRAETRLTAKIAPPTLAVVLQLSAGAPILRSEAINLDADGRPVEYGRTWFAGERVSLVAKDGGF